MSADQGFDVHRLPDATRRVFSVYAATTPTTNKSDFDVRYFSSVALLSESLLGMVRRVE